MTVALNDTALLADMLRPLPDLADPMATAAATAAFHTRRKPLSATINTLANALYRVFCAGPGAAHEAMRQACSCMFSSPSLCALSQLIRRSPATALVCLCACKQRVMWAARCIQRVCCCSGLPPVTEALQNVSAADSPDRTISAASGWAAVVGFKGCDCDCFWVVAGLFRLPAAGRPF